ncbi:MAG: transcriptional repressor LexA [Bdellovibrionales bacterium]|nr:transcriptional repressor LexA [Bdellovibrionales bacterium]
MAPKKQQPLPLSLKELRVLEFIEQFVEGHAVAPTYQEIKEHFGFASFNSVQRYLKQLQDKNYIRIPGGNQKRALQILHSSRSLSNLLATIPSSVKTPTTHPASIQPNKKEASFAEKSPPQRESLSLPLLGRVAAGLPIEAFTDNEFVEVPSHLVRNAAKTFALIVQGQSMIEDGILDGDIIFVQKQSYANNGETIVAMVNNQATVKRFYLHRNGRGSDIHINPQSHAHPSEQQVELRPANSTMESMWYAPYHVDIQGIVVGLIRRF